MLCSMHLYMIRGRLGCKLNYFNAPSHHFLQLIKGRLRTDTSSLDFLNNVLEFMRFPDSSHQLMHPHRQE